MTEAVFSKLDIACEYLDTAAQMYIDGHKYFCAIHLAAAATELLDGHLPEEARAYQRAQKAQKALHQIETGQTPSKHEVNEVLHGVRNAIKHMGDGDAEVTVDPRFEAKWWIDRALNNFEKLCLKKTTALWKYQDHRNAEMR